MAARRANLITPTRVEWHWPGWVPSARLILLGGKPGDGKSSVTVDLAARLTTASPLPDGYRPKAPLTVLLLNAEDDAKDTLLPRLISANADLERVIIANGMVLDDETGVPRPWVLPGDVDVLGQLVRENEVDLAIIDPLTAFVSTGVDTHRDASVRAMLHPLSQMARQDKCAIIGVRHHRKGGAADARDAGTGSIAFTAAARLEWVIGRDPQDQNRRVLAIAKSNIGKEPESLAYILAEAPNEWGTVQVAWQGTSPLTANQLVGEPTSEEERGALDEAVDFLRSVLGDGPVTAKDAERQAKDASISYPTLRRAKTRLKVRSRKSSGTGSWVWELPNQGAQDQDAQPSKGTHLGHVEHVEHLPSTHTLFNEGFSREGDQGAQGAQGDVLGMHEHLEGDFDDLSDEPPDDETLSRWADEASTLEQEQ
jgi:hypothetical protein